MTLDELTAALEACPKNAPVTYDFGCGVGRLASWRGVYAELTLTHDRSDTVTVKHLLDDCRSADGGTFTGYKGGEYQMCGSTPVWADDYGDCDQRMLLAVDGTSKPGSVILRTAETPDEYR